MTALIPISGNTYPVKEELKALGARWNAADKAWMVPADKAEEARRIVAGAPKGRSGSTGSYRRYTPRRRSGAGEAAPVPGYSSYCTARPGCGCYDCAS